MYFCMNLLIFNVDAMLNKCLILILIVNVISTLILGGDATFVINEKSTYFCTKSIIINIDTMLNKCLVPILKFNGFPH